MIGGPERDNHNKFTGAHAPLQQNLVKQSTIHGLYLHTPFCFHKCHYCDFYSIVEAGDTDRQAAFVDRLIAELRHRAGQFGRLRPRTIFVGGGTPTLLRQPLWRRLLDALRDLGCLDQVTEFTVEANPETVTDGPTDTLVAGGVNRVSLGAQSFQPALLKTLERWHEPASVVRAVHTVRDAGIDNINLDLIFGIPGQTMAMLDADLRAVLDLGPTHLSCYGLTYEPNTAMTQRLRQGQITPADEDLERDMYDRVMTQLETAGFEHYEVSNWVQPGHRCEHNLIYWTNQNWLAVGPSGASHVAGWRWKNIAHLGRYLAQQPEPPVVDVEHLPAARQVGAMLMLGLRLREGVPVSWLDEYVPTTDPRRTTIRELTALGLLEATDAHLRLTRRGLFVADSVIAKLL